MKKIILTLSFIFLIALAQAKLCDEFNQSEVIGVELPSGVPFSNEKANIYLGEELQASVSIEGKKITSFSCEAIEKPTYNVYISSSQVIDDIANSDSIVDAYNAKIKSGDIKIKGQSFTKSFKVSLINFFSKIAGWFV